MSAFWHAIEASDVVRRIGWALVHSIWLGTAAAGALAVADRVLRRRAANARYVAGCMALLAVVGLSVVACFIVPDRTGPASTPPQTLGPNAAAPQAQPRATVVPSAVAVSAVPDM